MVPGTQPSRNEYRKARRRFFSALQEQLNVVLDKIGDNILNAETYIDTEIMERAFKDVYGDLMPKAGNRIYSYFRKAKAIDVIPQELSREEWDRIVTLYLQMNTVERIVGITNYSAELVNKVIGEAIEQGLSIEQAQRLLRQQWTVMSRRRAIVIARTEIGTAMAAGDYAGAKAVGLPMTKTWLTALDGRERDWHGQANGQTVPLNAAFIVNGERMNYPLDPAGSAENVINCRCSMTYALA